MRALFGKAALGPVAGLVLLAGLGLMVAPDPARLEQVDAAFSCSTPSTC